MQRLLEAFAGLSERRRFSANARSLYLELLWQFGSDAVSEGKYLSNKVLQERSGIRSSNSFERAREELMNAGLIQHKKQVYRLGKAMENEWEANGKPMEKMAGGFIVEKNKNKNKKITTTTTTPTTTERVSAPALTPIQGGNAATQENTGQTVLSTNSAAVQHEWFLWNNANLKGGEALELIQLENLYGTAKLVEAIHAAGCADTRGVLSINFVKKVLARILNEGAEVTKTARRNAAKVTKVKEAAKTAYDTEDIF